MTITTVRIEPRYGYWDTTDYPIGGCFRRAGAEGLAVEVTRTFPWCHGCNTEGRTADGRTVAFDSSHAR